MPSDLVRNRHQKPNRLRYEQNGEWQIANPLPVEFGVDTMIRVKRRAAKPRDTNLFEPRILGMESNMAQGKPRRQTDARRWFNN